MLSKGDDLGQKNALSAHSLCIPLPFRCSPASHRREHEKYRESVLSHQLRISSYSRVLSNSCFANGHNGIIFRFSRRIFSTTFATSCLPIPCPFRLSSTSVCSIIAKFSPVGTKTISAICLPCSDPTHVIWTQA